MRTRAVAGICVLLFILSGCATVSEPENNQGFQHVSKISELTGVYDNYGDPQYYLSQFIFTNLPDYHYNIDLIEVSPIENGVLVKAIKDDCYIHAESFLLGKDFDLSGGKILLMRDATLIPMVAENVVTGPMYQQDSIGIDTDGHGKLKRSVFVTMILPLPFAAIGFEDIRFEKIPDINRVFKSCSQQNSSDTTLN